MREFTIPTRGLGLYEITHPVGDWVVGERLTAGLLTLHIKHTSASLLIQENADPDVMRDLGEFFARLAPESTPWFRHTTEGPDDMPAHIKAALTQSQVSVPIIGGRLSLGTWQGIYVFEHRRHAQKRTVAAHVMGE